jgi:GntR family transcriptional regulator, rspAB operon transcriptional repressor
MREPACSAHTDAGLLVKGITAGGCGENPLREKSARGSCGRPECFSAGWKKGKTWSEMVKHAVKTSKKPLGATAYEAICRKIITLEFRPGQILDEKQLMADLGIGRTPIRETLLRLAGDGWIELQPNRGAVVPSITLQSTKALFEAMRILESGISSLAVNQNNASLMPHMEAASERVKVAIRTGDVLGLVEANHDFHMDFAKCSNNEYLIRAVSEVRNQAKRLAYLSYSSEIEPERSLQVHYESVVNEHEEFMNCLKAKDEARLKEIVVQHIDTFQQRIIKYMAS